LIALIINVHTLGRMHAARQDRSPVTRGRTLTRKTSLLRKIEPTARRSGFANRIIHNPRRLATCGRRNDPEIVKARAIACTIQLGSISSLRCQITRTTCPWRTSVRIDVFADDDWLRGQPVFAL